MTIILAIRDKDGDLWMAGDSLASGEGEAYSVREPKVFSRGEFTYGYAGSFRLGHLVKHHLKEPKQPSDMSDQQYIMNKWSSELLKVMFAQGYMKEEYNVYSIDGTLIINYRGKMYLLQDDLSIIEPLDPFLATGAGSSFALGAVAATYNLMEPPKLLKHVLEVTSQFSPYCGGPFTIVRSK